MTACLLTVMCRLLISKYLSFPNIFATKSNKTNKCYCCIVLFLFSDEGFLVFAQSGAIKHTQYPYNPENVTYLYKSYDSYLVALDYDCSNNFIYFTDTRRNGIGRMKYYDENPVFRYDVKFPEGQRCYYFGRQQLPQNQGSNNDQGKKVIKKQFFSSDFITVRRDFRLIDQRNFQSIQEQAW